MCSKHNPIIEKILQFSTQRDEKMTCVRTLVQTSKHCWYGKLHSYNEIYELILHCRKLHDEFYTRFSFKISIRFSFFFPFFFFWHGKTFSSDNFCCCILPVVKFFHSQQFFNEKLIFDYSVFCLLSYLRDIFHKINKVREWNSLRLLHWLFTVSSRPAVDASWLKA